jgi:regulatory protein
VPGERLLADPEVRRQHARDVAWRALNRRDHTVAELRRVLEGKRVEPATVAEVLEELADGGWLDDARYARRFAEDRRHLDGWGSERIERRLRAVGIDAEHIAAALAQRPAEDESAAAIELLRRRFPDPPCDPRERNRALGVLVRRGYDLDLALDALRRYCGAGEFDEL